MTNLEWINTLSNDDSLEVMKAIVKTPCRFCSKMENDKDCEKCSVQNHTLKGELFYMIRLSDWLQLEHKEG